MSDELSFPMANGEEWPWLEEKEVRFEPVGSETAVQFSLQPVPGMARVEIGGLDSYAVPFSTAVLRIPAQPVYVSQMLTLSRCNAWIANVLGNVDPKSFSATFLNRLRSDEMLHVRCRLALVRQEGRRTIGEFEFGGVVQRTNRLVAVFAATAVIHRRL